MMNDHIDGLRALRALYVEARRERVAETLRHNCPAGHERRLSDVQSAIQAIDQAIKDEEEHAGSGDGGGHALESYRSEGRAEEQAAKNGRGSNGSGPHPAEQGEDPIEFAWRSYDAWRSGRKNGSRRTSN